MENDAIEAAGARKRQKRGEKSGGRDKEHGGTISQLGDTSPVVLAEVLQEVSVGAEVFLTIRKEKNSVEFRGICTVFCKRV